MQAICSTHRGTVELRHVPTPSPGSGEALVKVFAAAQNPTDLKTLYVHKKEGAVLGCDFSGTIIELGSNITEQDISVGERVAGFVHGGIGNRGAFAEYVIAPVRTLLKIPATWTYQEAAQLSLAGYTACQCLYQIQRLPTPFEPVTEALDILVWGGTTAVGHITIQLAAMGGMRVITTASPRHATSLKALGAAEVFDYRDPKVGKKIHAFTNGKLVHAIDCISEKTTPFQVANALSQEGGTISCLLPYPKLKRGIVSTMALAYTVLGHAFEFPDRYQPQREDIEFGDRAADMLNRLLASGKLTPMRMKLFTDGLTSVFDGLAYMTEGKVSAEKVTYVLPKGDDGDTPESDLSGSVVSVH